MTNKVLIAIVVIVVASVGQSTARAWCGTASLDGGDNVAVIGEAVIRHYIEGIGYWYAKTGRAVVCWTDQHGQTQATHLTGCNGSTSSSLLDNLYISAGAGNDVVSVHAGITSRAQ